MNNSCVAKPIYRIGVDFDLTMVDSLTPWVNWFNDTNDMILKNLNHELEFFDQSKIDFKPITKVCYTEFKDDLAILMRERISCFPIGYQIDPMEWWRQQDLYDNMPPLVGALTWMMLVRETLTLKHGFGAVEFVCVSKCEPEHERSKRRFLPTHFPDIFSGFISTDDKHLVAIDCLVDDNPKYIKPCNENNIFQIYIPHGNYPPFPSGEEFVEEMLYIKPRENFDHFMFLIENNEDICDMLHRHYNYVR